MVIFCPACVKITPKNPFLSSPSDPLFSGFCSFFLSPLAPPSGVGLIAGLLCFGLGFGVVGFFVSCLPVVVGFV
tara:strand:- start:396 stop:617 length:222 start_codon:yes stop_codon:yes gene_type:complete